MSTHIMAPQTITTRSAKRNASATRSIRCAPQFCPIKGVKAIERAAEAISSHGITSMMRNEGSENCRRNRRECIGDGRWKPDGKNSFPRTQQFCDRWNMQIQNAHAYAKNPERNE